MSTSLAVVSNHAPVPWSKMDDEQKNLIKQVCSGTQLNDTEFALLVEASIRSGLDIVRRQVYGLKFGGKMTVFTGIDGFRAVARRGGLAGVDDAVHTYAADDTAQRFPMTSTVTVYRYGPKGEREAYTATARFHEYARKQHGKPVDNWLTKPHVMLDKCAEALAYRKAFTESLGGIYERAEFANEEIVRQVNNEPVPLEHIIDVSAQPEKVEGWDDGYVTTDTVTGPDE